MSGGGSARKEINMDNKAYQKMDYALCLLSAAADGKRHGCIVNSFHQVTSSFPPKFTVAVNKDHETCKAIQAAGSFSVTLLGADAPGEIIDLFGYIAGISSGIKNIVRRMAVNCPNHNILTTGKRAIIGCKPAQRCMDFL